jgi:predicted nucleotidyltransferase
MAESKSAIAPQPQEIEQLLRQLLQHDAEIAFAYLFGSVAKGKACPESDIDVAIALEPPPAPQIAFDRQLDLQERLEKSLRRPVDVVLLNTAPLELAHNVLCHGIPLFINDKAAHSRFYVTHAWTYYDLQKARELFTKGLVRRIKEGRFGGGTGNYSQTSRDD